MFRLLPLLQQQSDRQCKAILEISGEGNGDISIYVGGQKLTGYVIKDVRNKEEYESVPLFHV